MATSAPESEAGVLVVRRHHLLARCSHWLNAPILLGLILSGVSIYGGSWRTAPSACTSKARLKECKGYYQNHLCRGRA